MKLLILGDNTNIGNALSTYFFKDNVKYQVISLNQSYLDITDKKETIKYLVKLSPDMVIHAAEISNIDYCEFNKEDCHKNNTIGASNVAESCNILDIPIAFISSSEVYGDGNNSTFTEDSVCLPMNYYGKCKLDAENLIKSTCEKHFIIRPSWCFGGTDCYVKKTLQNKNIPVFVSSDEVVNPTNLEDLCTMVEQLISSTEYGTYNCSGSTYASKLDVIKHIFNILGIEKNVVPIPAETRALIAPRSSFTALNTYKVEKQFNIELPSWQESIKDYIDKL